MSMTEGQAHRRPTVTCSTDDVPVAARAALWRETIGASYPGLAVDWLADGPIRARFASRPFGDARVTDISNTPIRLAHRPQSGADRGYQLVLQVAGTGSYAHNGREVVQEPGDLVLLDTALPFDSLFPVDLRVVVWDLPRALLAPLLADPDEAAARRIRGGEGLGAVLAGYARTVAAEAGRLDAPAEIAPVAGSCHRGRYLWRMPGRSTHAGRSASTTVVSRPGVTWGGTSISEVKAPLASIGPVS